MKKWILLKKKVYWGITDILILPTFKVYNLIHVDICVQLWNHQHQSRQWTFPPSKVFLWPFLISLSHSFPSLSTPTSVPRKPLILFLSPYIRLHYLQFYIHEIITVCILCWSGFFHSASLFRFIQVAACIKSSFHFIVKQ